MATGTRARRIATILASLAVLAACTTPADTGSAAAMPSDTPTAEPTESPSPSPSPSAAATTEPSESPRDAAQCDSEPPTAMSEDWTEHTGFTPDYRFMAPSEWEAQDTVRLDMDIAVSPETFDSIGFPDSAILPVDLLVGPDGGMSAWVIESRIDTPTDELFATELAWLEEQPQIVEVIDDTLETCIDGSTALGFSSTWSFPDGDRYVEIYMLQRNGKIYQTQLTAQDDEAGEAFAEVLRTWVWTEPLEASDGGAGPGADGDIEEQLAATDFAIAGVMTGFEEADWPDGPPPLREYDDLFGDEERIYVVYQLDSGVADTVTVSWYLDGELQTEGDQEYLEEHLYAWAWINPASGGFELGSYEVVLELEEGGDSVVIPFEVEDR